jgi:hypothetical protein
LVQSVLQQKAGEQQLKTALNNCKIQSYWWIKFNKSGDGASVSYEADITTTGTTKNDCSSLTPNFTNIGHN